MYSLSIIVRSKASRPFLQALAYLHEKDIIHRDVRGNNVLLTKEGEVKLTDFGLSCRGKATECLGAPCWMAPEMVATRSSGEAGYDQRVDVWAVGVLAIELGDGKAPLQDMHATRAMFQIERNPPPTLSRPANWPEVYNDFLDEYDFSFFLELWIGALVNFVLYYHILLITFN